MSGRDVSDADMPNIPGSQRADVPELPDGTLDALLTGDLVTDEACAGLQPAAALLAALNAAPQDGELAGHARVLAEFRRRGGMPVHARRSARRRPRLLTSLTAKAAAAAAVAATALGGVAAAAYTSTLPAPAQQFAHSVIGAPSPQPSRRPGTPQATPARTGCRRPGRHRPGGVRAVHRLRPREGAWPGIPEGGGVPQPGGGSRRRGQDRRLLRGGAPPGQLAAQPAGPGPPGRPLRLAPHREAIVASRPAPGRPALLRAHHALDPAG